VSYHNCLISQVVLPLLGLRDKDSFREEVFVVKKIYIVGDINEETYRSFSKKLAFVESIVKPLSNTVEIELMSDGGSAMTALAFYDRIINSPLTINVTATGAVQSAAVVILAAGDTRRMTRSAWIMVHEDSITFENETLNVSQIEAYAKNYRKFETQWCRILEGETSASFETWTELHNKTTYLSPEECMKLGIIEKIV
jgi:ATP-dependent protease ClpP protease subunit